MNKLFLLLLLLLYYINIIKCVLLRGGTCPIQHITVQKIDRDGIKGNINSHQILRHMGTYSGLNSFYSEGNEKIAAHIINSNNIPFASTRSHYFSCWDGRSKYAAFGTPGGDLAHFILVLRALELMPNENEFYSQKQVDTYFEDYIAERDKFYMHSDEFTMSRWAEAANVTDPLNPLTSDEMKAVLHNAPRFPGCEHIEAMIRHPLAYETRRELVEFAIRSVIKLLIDDTTPPELKDKILFVVYKDYPHEESAFVDILSPFVKPPNAPKRKDWLHPQPGIMPDEKTPSNPLTSCTFRAPLVQPKIKGRSILIYHARAVYENWAAIAHWMARHKDKSSAWKVQLFSKMVKIGDTQVKNSKALFAGNIPTFLASFQ